MIVIGSLVVAVALRTSRREPQLHAMTIKSRVAAALLTDWKDVFGQIAQLTLVEEMKDANQDCQGLSAAHETNPNGPRYNSWYVAQPYAFSGDRYGLRFWSSLDGV